MHVLGVIIFSLFLLYFGLVNQFYPIELRSAKSTFGGQSYIFLNEGKDANYYLSKGYQVFKKFNLAIKLPVKLTDMSSQTKSNNGLFYGGFLNNNSESKVVFYQVIINPLPAGGTEEFDFFPFDDKINLSVCYNPTSEQVTSINFGDRKTYSDYENLSTLSKISVSLCDPYYGCRFPF